MNRSATCAIHQPNFFPWLGYFDKMARADEFVFLDDVAYPRSGSGMGSWVNRVRVAIQGEAQWITCPLRRYSGTRRIREVEINDDLDWRTKLLKTLAYNYRRAPHFEPAIEVLKPLILFETTNLADYNINAITRLAALFGLRCHFWRQSEMKVGGAATELLVSITHAAGCGVYLCGGGAGGYQEDARFAAAGIELRNQNFEPAPYGVADRFIPGLSVIDYLMHESADSLRPWLAAA